MPDIITRALFESKGIPTRDIVAAIWGRKLSGGYTSTELTGTLPLTFRSNGSVLLDYRIYGNTEVQGVGVRTENLFDPNAAETSGNNIISDFMPLDPSELVLTMAFDIPLRASYNYEITYYDSTKTAISFVGGMGEAYKTRETVKFNRQSEAPNAAYVKFTLPKDLTNVLIQNGSTDGAYIPYGYKMPMVSRTENLFDKDTYLVGGTLAPVITGDCYDFVIHLKANTTYVMSSDVPYVGGMNHLYVYSAGYTNPYQMVYNNHPAEVRTGEDGCIYLRYAKRSYYDQLLDGTYYVMLTEGSTVPTSYIPYHRTDTPIYIGNTQLMQDEYVSYGEQKIYREVGGTLTPTDPPVPLPQLPTFSNTATVLDYEETPAPEEAWVKYKKGD